MASKFQVLEKLGSTGCPAQFGFPRADIGRALAGGSFGVVYKAIEKESNTIVAIKQVRSE